MIKNDLITEVTFMLLICWHEIYSTFPPLHVTHKAQEDPLLNSIFAHFKTTHETTHLSPILLFNFSYCADKYL